MNMIDDHMFWNEAYFEKNEKSVEIYQGTHITCNLFDGRTKVFNRSVSVFLFLQYTEF